MNRAIHHVRRFTVLALAVTCLALVQPGMAGTTRPSDAGQPQELPTTYEAGHFHAVPETTSGHRLKLLVDTGGGGFGGMYWISTSAATRLHLQTHECGSGEEQVTVAGLPEYRVGRALPPPLPGPCGESVLIQPHGGFGDDGQLGAGYLRGRVWTFDYPARQLILEDKTWHPGPAAHAISLDFQRDATGQPTSGFPGITIRVDGQPLGMLLDTGATAHPTAAGERASDTPLIDGYGAASYITTSVLERWHADHPEWRVVDKGDDLFGADHATRLIEVPELEIAGWSVGPVWFTERSDAAFHKFMAQWMDKPPEGAVGGNIFRHFVMTIDYPRATAYLRCVRGCRPVFAAPRTP